MDKELIKAAVKRWMNELTYDLYENDPPIASKLEELLKELEADTD